MYIAPAPPVLHVAIVAVSELELSRIKRQRVRKIIANLPSKDLPNLAVSSFSNPKELSKKFLLTLNHLRSAFLSRLTPYPYVTRVDLNPKEFLGGCEVFLAFSQPMAIAMKQLSSGSLPAKQPQPRQEHIISSTFTVEAVNSEITMPFDTELEKFREKYWLNGQLFDVRRPKKTNFMCLKLVTPLTQTIS